MQTANRAAPHVILGVFTLMSVGAVVLSLSMAPPNAGQQLRTAAANTAGASSFVLTDTETAGPATANTPSSSVSREQAVIVYQAPDSVKETVSYAGGRTASVLVVGNKHYEKSANGKWYLVAYPATTSGASAGARAVSDILYPLQSLSEATDVTISHDVYRFIPGHPSLLLARVLGTAISSGSTAYAGSVAGEFLRYEEVAVQVSGEQVIVVLAFSRVEHAPPLAVPPPSQLTTVPPAS